MCWRKIVGLLSLCNTPSSIISPFPFFALSLFLISKQSLFNLPILFAGIVTSLFSNFASNLWNHCNDLKEDIAQDKKTILTQDISVQKLALLGSVLLYSCSMLIVYYLSVEFKRPIYLYFSIWAIATWWYSDRFFIKRLVGFRLKDHYTGELITYSIAWPMYTLGIWLIYSDLNTTGLMVSVAFFFFGISVLLLKDLKDISGDLKIGLRTFGVVFPPSQLLRYSCYFMIMYYLAIMVPLVLDMFNRGILLLVFPLVYFLKNTFFHMHKKNWLLDGGDLKAVKSIGNSTFASIIFIGLSTFF